MSHSEAFPGTDRVIDKSFDKAYTRESTLCVLLREKRLSYAVFDNERDKYLVYDTAYFHHVNGPQQYLSNLRSSIANLELLHLPFKAVKIGLAYSPAVLVPAELYVEEEAGAHLQLQSQLAESDLIRWDKLPDIDAVLEYSSDRDIDQFLRDSFENPTLFHAKSALLKALTDSRVSAGNNIAIHVHAETFTLVYLRDGKLQLINDFNFRSREDFIYFVLACCEQIGIDKDEVDFTLYGELVEDSAVYEISRKYLKNVKLGSRPAQFAYNRGIRELPDQFHFNLFALNLCE